MIGLLVWLLVFALVVWIAFYIVQMLPLPDVPKKIIVLVIALIFLIILLQALFGGLALPGVHWGRQL